MILTTTDTIPNKTIAKSIGLVSGATVRTTSATDDIMTGIKGLVGGELKSTFKILSQARDEAMDRLEEDANAKGADAVVGISIRTNSNIFGAVEIFIYGTAVKLA